MARKKHPAADNPEDDLTPHLPTPLPDNMVVSLTPEGQEKLSEVFLRFIKPLLVNVEDLTEDEIRTRLSIAMIAWNIASFPLSCRAQELITMIKEVPDKVKFIIKTELARLVERKERRFAEYHWLIYDYHLEMKPVGGFKLTVTAYTLPDENT